jgi:hypothetical protein
MANTPKKVKDPTEVALSAIQEALNINDGAAENSDTAPHVDVPASPAVVPTPPSFNEPSFETRPSTDAATFEPIEDIRQTRRAANDDRETIGQILQAIQKGRPARSVYTLATVFAGVWVVGSGLLTLPSCLRCTQRWARASAARWCSRASPRCSLRPFS